MPCLMFSPRRTPSRLIFNFEDSLFHFNLIDSVHLRGAASNGRWASFARAVPMCC
jgi:hypothetical protein